MASVSRRKDGRPGYQVRYRDPAGEQRARQFDRKAAADRFAATVETDKLRGAYLDPKAGRMTLQEYGATWLTSQTFDSSTREAVELRLRLHVYPTLGTTALAALRPSQLQAWLRGLQQTLAPRYVRVILANLSAVLAAAVDDERIVRNPCQASSVKPPSVPAGKVVPWAPEQVLAASCSTAGSPSGPLPSTSGTPIRGFTLRVYTHLMPASEERTKRAVDQALRAPVPVRDSTACAPNVHRGPL